MTTRTDNDMTANERIDTVVIGGGQAGLNVSRALQMVDVDHVVLERGRIGESWASQRWESFRLNTPNWANGLLGWEYDGPDPDGYMTAGELRDRMVQFVERYELPVRDGVSVAAVRRDGEMFGVETADGEVITCRNVVVCSGGQNSPRIPQLAERLGDVDQMHAADYRRPDQLADGGVLIVGSAQTGGQIAEELAAAGRETWLSTSDVGSAPRRYRGRDIADWMQQIGIIHAPVETLDDPAERYAAQALLSGANGGRTLTLHGLARQGVNVVGRLTGVDDDGTTVRLADDLVRNATTGLEALARTRAGIDQFIDAAGVEAPAAEDDPAAEISDRIDELAEIRELDLVAHGIGTVIWATGFVGNFSFLHVELDHDDHGVPVQQGGAAAGVEGLWFCGLPWLRIQSSGLIYGSGVDARAVVERIVEANATRRQLADASA